MVAGSGVLEPAARLTFFRCPAVGGCAMISVMHRPGPTRLLNTLLALAFLLNAAARPLAMSVSLESGAATHQAMSLMSHSMATPAESHPGHTPAEHRRCSDECCGISVSAFTVSGATVSLLIAPPAAGPLAFTHSAPAPRGDPRYRQPPPIGPPASRA